MRVPALSFKVTFAGALVALALAVTYTSSADAFSDFDRRTIPAFGGTVTAALLLLAPGARTIPIALLASVGRAAAIALVLIALAGVTFAGVLEVTYSSSAEAFSVFRIGAVSAAFDNTVDAALLSGALLLLASACRSATDTPLKANTLLALVTLAGVTTTYLVHTDLWTSPAIVIPLCAAAGFALFVAFRVIDDRPLAGVPLSAAALAGLAAVIVDHAEPRVEAVSGDVSNIRNVSLSETPNLYFISFDALAPRTLLKRYLGVENTGFHALFDARFRRLPNLFSNGSATKPTLYSLLALDPRVHESQAAVLGNDTRTFSGQHPSPLLDILRRSGYETSTLFYNTYFGRRKGPSVDNYIYFQDRTLCSLLDEAIRPWAFWGYCRWFRHEGSSYTPSVGRITRVDVDGGPQFMMAHMVIPGHTPVVTYRHGDALADYRVQYLAGIERAAGSLDRIVRHVEADPDAILLVYGDHGMWVSRGVEFDDDPEFVIQDRYGVLGGVFPPDACAPWFDAAAAPGWMTLLDAVHAVLFCLSDGKGALVDPEIVRQQYAHFEDFLYE